MAGNHSIAPGGVIRTYGRLHPLRRLQQQTWLSPATDRNHLFSSSSSSSHLSSPNNVSPSDDSDFLPAKRKKVGRRKKKVKPPEKVAVPRKRRKKQPQKSPPCQASEKENEVLPDGTSNSPLIFTTPFRKFVTFRRKAPPLDMKPLSGKPKREEHTPSSSDDFEVKRRRKLGPDEVERRRKLGQDEVARKLGPDEVTRKLGPDEAMRRRKLGQDEVVRELGPDEATRRRKLGQDEVAKKLGPDEVTRRRKLGPDEATRKLGPDDSSVDALGSPLRKAPLLSSTPSVLLTAMPRTETSFVRQMALCGPLEESVVRCCSEAEDKEDLLFGDITRKLHSIDLVDSHVWEEKGKVGQENCLRRSEVGSFINQNGAGSGVKCLSITMSHGRSPLCLLSPVSVSSSESLIGRDEKSERYNVFCASPELFSDDTSPVMDFLADEAAMFDGSPSSRFLKGISADKWKYFRRKPFQPVVTLYSEAVAEYLQRQKKVVQEEGPPGIPNVRTRDVSLQQMQPVVRLDRQSVTKYFKEKNLAKTPSIEPPPCRQDPASPGMQTPLVTASMPKRHIVTSAAPQEATGRKVCISGFSVKRWGNFRKKSSKAQQQLSFQDYGDTFQGKEDWGALPTLHFSPSLLTSSFLNSTVVRNLDLSTESAPDPQRDHQRWARLRAALTLHRKKKVEGGAASSHPAGRKYWNQSAHGNSSSLLLLSPSSSLCCDELTDAEKVLAECHQEKPITFHQCLTQDQLDRCQKVGEGVYGEVFRTLRGKELVALKIIPIEGSQKVNGEHQKSFAEILPEIIISKELSLLSGGESNMTSGFIKLHSAYCVKGSYPMELLVAWDDFAEEKGSENERPDLFGAEQLFMILEFEFGGDDLERMSSKVPSVSASRSILHQVTAALAVAEEELRFEHRDLHWGNLLIETCSQRTLSASLQGKIFHIPTAGVQVKIIDYTLSRLDKDGLTVFCDLSADEDLFLGKGDLQFDVYRRMREENRNGWSRYAPHSNVLWLHYLCDKLLSEVQYVRKPTSATYQKELRKLRDFRREVRQFNSATDILQRNKLFH